MNYYAATVKDRIDYSSLAGPANADVCVIGGGFTGLGAALNLAERGLRVVLLEAEQIAWGASGRNGGQIGSGQRLDQGELERRFGVQTARLLWELAEEAKSEVRDRVAQHAIDCDLRDGQLVVAVKRAHAEHLRRHAEKLAADYSYSRARYVPAAELPAMLGGGEFHGGLLDAGAMHLHPLNFAIGLARACATAGVLIHERSRVTSVTGTGRMVVRTAAGEVRADHVVLGCDAYLGGLEPRIASHMIPINNFMIATAPLSPERASRLIRDDVCVHDTRFVVNYFRLSADRRLLFGGGETYGSAFPPDIRAFVRPHALRIFPQLADVRVDFGWGGALGVTRTRLPHVGRLPPALWFAHGFSGHGIATGLLAGKLIAEAITGTAGRFDVMAGIAPPAFPGGTLLRWPLLVLGMLYYALRDRI
jgi:gamma-glutamylputrescine oxidase